MSKPKLKIGDTDFTEYVKAISPSNNDLDAEGSGRDIHSGKMYRSKVADKDTIEVAMMRLWAATVVTLRSALNHEYVNVKYLNPKTNQETTKEMYCSSINHGLQLYDKSKNDTFYEGVAFQLTER